MSSKIDKKILNITFQTLNKVYQIDKSILIELFSKDEIAIYGILHRPTILHLLMDKKSSHYNNFNVYKAASNLSFLFCSATTDSEYDQTFQACKFYREVSKQDYIKVLETIKNFWKETQFLDQHINGYSPDHEELLEHPCITKLLSKGLHSSWDVYKELTHFFNLFNEDEIYEHAIIEIFLAHHGAYYLTSFSAFMDYMLRNDISIKTFYHLCIFLVLSNSPYFENMEFKPRLLYISSDCLLRLILDSIRKTHQYNIEDDISLKVLECVVDFRNQPRDITEYRNLINDPRTKEYIKKTLCAISENNVNSKIQKKCIFFMFNSEDILKNTINEIILENRNKIDSSLVKMWNKFKLTH